MAERPLLIIQRAEIEPRQRLGGGGSSITKPSASQQRQRLDAKFHHIAQSFQNFQTGVQGLEPEQVIVMETLGKTVDGLAKAATKIPGLEWLAEMDLENAEPSYGFYEEGHPDSSPYTFLWLNDDMELDRNRHLLVQKIFKKSQS